MRTEESLGYYEVAAHQQFVRLRQACDKVIRKSPAGYGGSNPPSRKRQGKCSLVRAYSG